MVSNSKRKKATTQALSTSNDVNFGGVRLSFRQTVAGLLVLSIALFAISGWFWWKSILMDPETALQDMLFDSLQTSSVTKEVSQKDPQSQVNQIVRLHLSPTPTAQSITKVQQAGLDGPTAVTTETIGTQKQDYVRYKAINSASLTGSDALKNVIGTWGSRAGGEQPVTFFNEAVIGLVPFGNLDPVGRDKVLKILHNKNVYNYSEARRTFEHGRPTLVYNLNIAPEGLVEALATYAKVTGYGEESQLDSKAYAGAPALEIEMTIDALSRHLTSLRYKQSDRVEHYSGFGLKAAIPAPSQTISVNELQTRLQSLQKPQVN